MAEDLNGLFVGPIVNDVAEEIRVRSGGDTLGLEPGVEIWISIKATEIVLEPDGE